MSKLPNVQLLFGPLLIGAFLNTILYGILLFQFFIYFRTYRNDVAWMKYFLLYLLFCDTVDTIVTIGIVYEPLVFRYGTSRATQRVPILLFFSPLITAIISTSVQLFVCWRISKITASMLIPVTIGLLSLISLGGGVATCICGGIFDDFALLERFNGAVIVWLTSSAIADTSVTFIMTISMRKRRTRGIADTDDVVDRIIRHTICAGALTVFFATMDMVLFVTMPKKLLNFAFDFPLTKLYTNSLLLTLNARRKPHRNNIVIHRPLSLNINENHKNMHDFKSSILSSCVFTTLPKSPSPTAGYHPQNNRPFHFNMDSYAADNYDGDTSLKPSIHEVKRTSHISCECIVHISSVF